MQKTQQNRPATLVYTGRQTAGARRGSPNAAAQMNEEKDQGKHKQQQSPPSHSHVESHSRLPPPNRLEALILARSAI